MHSAPSVTYPVGRLLLERGLTWVLSALAGGATCITLVTQPWGWGPALTLSSLLVAGLCHQRWRTAPRGGFLSWDGKEWWLHREAANLSGGVSVEWDLQGFLLLRFQPTTSTASRQPRLAGGQWLWLARQANPVQWADLRRAVYCRVS
jgi:toxin CptA